MSHGGEHAGRELVLSLGRRALLHTQMGRKQQREKKSHMSHTVCVYGYCQLSAVT